MCGLSEETILWSKVIKTRHNLRFTNTFSISRFWNWAARNQV